MTQKVFPSLIFCDSSLGADRLSHKCRTAQLELEQILCEVLALLPCCRAILRRAEPPTQGSYPDEYMQGFQGKSLVMGRSLGVETGKTLSSPIKEGGGFGTCNTFGAEESQPEVLKLSVTPAALRKAQTSETLHSTFKYLVLPLQMLC